MTSISRRLRWLLGSIVIVVCLVGCDDGGTGGTDAAAGRGGSGGNTGNGGRGGAGGAATFDGGFPDAFNFDGLNLDAILADAGITTCAASVMAGSACTSGTDTGCQQPSGGGFCFCPGAGTWSCF